MKFLAASLPALFAALFLMSPAAAQNVDDEYCPEMSRFAERLMAERQAGIPMADVVTRLRQYSAGSPADSAAHERLIGLVFIAYEYPRQGAEIDRQAAIEMFRESVAMGCFRAQYDRPQP